MGDIPTPRGDRSNLWFAVGLILGAAIGYFFGARAYRMNAGTNEPVANAFPTAIVDVSVEGRPFKGPEDAKVTILEFTDFECSFCAQFYHETYKPLVARYGDRVRFVTRNFPIAQIHPHAEKAAEAAECAGDQSRYWSYHDMLFEHQEALDEESLLRYGSDLGLDVAQFGECLSSGEKAEVIRTDMEAAFSYGVEGSPTFFINGLRIEGVVPFETLEQLVEQAEKESGEGS